jgi:tRNA threonylcarbamoyladenosine biosynthesis protein TsaB
MNVLSFNQAIFPSIIVFGSEKGIVFSVLEIPLDESPNNLIYLAYNMFNTLRIDRKTIEALSVVYGPGSFTGTRIGVVDAKIIAYALRVPLFAINSLELIATHFNKNALVVVPAGRKEYFGAVFENGVRLSEDTILSEDELKAYDSTVISHDGQIEQIVKQKFVQINLCPEKLLQLTFKQKELGKALNDPLSLTPEYLHAIDIIFKKVKK